MSRISCPMECVYLDSGSEYQRKRLARNSRRRRAFYQEMGDLGGQKAVALFNLIEVIIFSYFEGRRDGQDAEVVAALQAFRRTLSPLHIPSTPMPVFAEHLRKEYEAFRKQNPEQVAALSDAPARYWIGLSSLYQRFQGRIFSPAGFWED